MKGVLVRTALAAAGVVGLWGCEQDSGDDEPTGDCRQAALACAPGFQCVQVSVTAFDCVPSGGGGRFDRGTPPPVNDAGPGPGPMNDAAPNRPDPRVDVSNARVTGDGPNAAGDAELAFIGRPVSVVFDYAIRQGPECESCRAQIVIGVGDVGVLCAFDDSPGLAGRTGRADVQVEVPSEPGRYDVAWKRTDEGDCAAALEAFAGSDGPGGALATLEVRHPLGPLGGGGEPQHLPAGRQPECLELACPEGMFAVGGGGFFGGNHDEIDNGVGSSPDRWRRCLVGERDDVGEGEGQLRVACAAVPGGTVTTRPRTQPVGRDQQATIRAGCAGDEVLIGGGGEWPVDWQPFANRPVVDPGTGKLVWEISGVGAPGEVTVQAVCATGVPEPMLVSQETFVLPGGQCADVRCPDGLLRLTGGALWEAGMDPDQNRPGDAVSWTFCALNNVREERPFLVSALCVPIQR